MKYQTIEDTIYFWFGSNDTSGSGSDGANPLYDVRLGGSSASAAPVLSGSATLLTHANYPAGCHEIAVAATSGNGFAANNVYGVFATILVDSQNPTGFVGDFALNPIPADAIQISGDTTAANNLELDYDGTGLIRANSTIGTCTTNTDMRGTNSANTVVPPTEAQMNARTIPSADYLVEGDTLARVTLVDTTTTNTDMVGTDNAALASALATHDGKLDTVDTNVDVILVDTSSTIPAQITALNDLSAADVNAEVVDVIRTDTSSEPGQGNPPATTTLSTKVDYLYKMLRNKKTSTATQASLYNDAGDTVDQKATLSDDGTTATIWELITGA